MNLQNCLDRFIYYINITKSRDHIIITSLLENINSLPIISAKNKYIFGIF